jgi:hypothetical protein
MSPLVQRIKPSRAMLRSKPPSANGSTAVVYVTRNRRYIPTRPLTGSEIWFSPPHTAYLVDTSIHSTTMKLELPSSVEALPFDAEVRVAWRVASPFEAIDSGLEDGDAVIHALLVERLRELSRRHEAEDSPGAERAINEAFGRREFKLPLGLAVIWCVASVNLHKDARAHNASETRAAWAADERVLKHESLVKDAQLTQVEAIEKDKADTVLEEQRIECETRNKQHEIAMKELDIAFAAKRIDEGLIGMHKAHLAEHPKDTSSVINILMKEEKTVFDKERVLWEIAVDHGLTSPAHFSGPLNKLAAGIVAHVVPDRDGGLGETVLGKLEQKHPTVDGEVVEESEKAGDSDTEDDEDDNPI